MTSILRASSRPLLMVALALAGCGKAADTDVTPAPESNPATAATAAPSETAPVVRHDGFAESAGDVGRGHRRSANARGRPREARGCSGRRHARSRGGGRRGCSEARSSNRSSSTSCSRGSPRTRRPSLPSSTPGPPGAVLARRTSPTSSRCTRSIADKGLAVVSLSFDDPAKPKQVDEATEFLTEKKAVFTNFLLDEEYGVGFEKLNISAIPAVFLLRARRQGSETVHHGRPQQPVHLRRGREGRRGPARRQAAPEGREEQAGREVSEPRKKERVPSLAHDRSVCYNLWVELGGSPGWFSRVARRSTASWVEPSIELDQIMKDGIHPKYQECDRDLRLRQHVQDAQHEAQDRGRSLLEVPPVLHRVGEVRRRRRPGRQVQQEVPGDLRQGQEGSGRDEAPAKA